MTYRCVFILLCSFTSFEPALKVIKRGHSNKAIVLKIYCELFSCCAVHYVVQGGSKFRIESLELRVDGPLEKEKKENSQGFYLYEALGFVIMKNIYISSQKEFVFVSSYINNTHYT